MTERLSSPGESATISPVGKYFPRPKSAEELYVAFVPAIVMLAFTVFSPRLMADGDPFWHIAAGEWMIDHRAVLHEDPFSFTFAGAPWNAHEWLSEILMAATYRGAGWNGLYLLFGLVFGATAFLLAQQLLKYLDPVPALFLCLFALADIKGWVSMRPHVFALPILVLWAGELIAARSENRAPHWFLIPLMTLWVNLHASFLFGVAVIVPFAVEAILAAKGARFRTAASWGPVSLGTLLAALVNPAGVAGLLFPIAFTATPTTSLIVEWQSATFNVLGPLEVSFLAGLFLFLLVGVRMPAIRLLVLLGMVHMTLQHQRFAIILAIVGAMILAQPIADALKSRGWTKTGSDTAVVNPWAASAGALLVVLCIVVAGYAFPRTPQNDDLSPVSALAHVPPAIANRPVFNEWIFGGYLIFTGLRPFLDGRTEVYGDRFVRNYLQITRPDKSALEETFAKYKVVWTLLSPENRANIILDLLPDWCTLYADRFAVVHVRKDAFGGTERSCQPS